MPNQRKKGKTRIAIWLTPQQRKELDELVKAGVAKDMSDFVTQAIEVQHRTINKEMPANGNL